MEQLSIQSQQSISSEGNYFVEDEELKNVDIEFCNQEQINKVNFIVENISSNNNSLIEKQQIPQEELKSQQIQENTNQNDKQDQQLGTQNSMKININFISSLVTKIREYQPVLSDYIQDSFNMIQECSHGVQTIMLSFESSQHLVPKMMVQIQGTLIIMQQQFCQVTELITCDKPYQFLQPEQQQQQYAYIKQKYSALEIFAIPANTKDDLNMKEIQETVNYMNSNYLKDIIDIIRQFQTNLQAILAKKDAIQEIINDLKITHSKLLSCIELFPWACVFDRNNLFSLSKSDKIWLELNKFVEIKRIADKDYLRKEIKRINKKAMLFQSFLSNKNSQQSGIKKMAGAITYLFNPKKAQKQAQVFVSDFKTQEILQIQTLADSQMSAFVKNIIAPLVKYNQKIYIDPIVSQITLESIKKEYADNTINKISANCQVELLQLKNKVENTDAFYKSLFVKGNQKIKIRILSKENLFRPEVKTNLKNFKYEKIQGYFKKIFLGQDKNKFYNQIIIQIHGGGFVVGSQAYQVFCRRWVNQINVPVFSIEYRLAPQYPFPAALDDCWQAYNWILKYVDLFFNIKPKRIVIVGDSAGGNLAAALTIKCIKEQIRVPDGVLLQYPAMNLNPHIYSPSLLLSLDDQILSHNFLKTCINSYIPPEAGLKPDIDPLLSPLYISQEILKQFPPTRLQIGTKDPLHDDCWSFMKLLREQQKDVKMIEYQDLPHGFLQYDVPGGIKESRQCVIDSANLILDLLRCEEDIK